MVKFLDSASTASDHGWTMELEPQPFGTAHLRSFRSFATILRGSKVSAPSLQFPESSALQPNLLNSSAEPSLNIPCPAVQAPNASTTLFFFLMWLALAHQVTRRKKSTPPRLSRWHTGRSSVSCERSPWASIASRLDGWQAREGFNRVTLNAAGSMV